MLPYLTQKEEKRGKQRKKLEFVPANLYVI
jgi:hypothetical protein